MPTTAKPLPCPFCGGEAHITSELRPGYEDLRSDPDAWAFWYACNSCACHGGWSKSETSALRWWNMRTKK
jgi:hypothetical protein